MYSKQRKIEVILFLIHHRVQSNYDPTIYRRPTFSEAATYWKIPDATIYDWWKNQDKIISQIGNTYWTQNKYWFCQWPKLEQELFQLFLIQ